MDETAFFWILGVFIAVFCGAFWMVKASIVELRRRIVELEKLSSVLKHKAGIN